MKTVKLSQDQLQHLIKEEISRVKRGTKRGLKEAGQSRRVSEGTYAVSAFDMLRFARAYARLGGAVQDQLHHILDTPDAPVNSNAVAMIEEKLAGMNADVDFAIKNWKRNNSEEPGEGEADEDGYYADGTKDLRGSEPSGVRRPKR